MILLTFCLPDAKRGKRKNNESLELLKAKFKLRRILTLLLMI